MQEVDKGRKTREIGQNMCTIFQTLNEAVEAVKGIIEGEEHEEVCILEAELVGIGEMCRCAKVTLK